MDASAVIREVLFDEAELEGHRHTHVCLNVVEAGLDRGVDVALFHHKFPRRPPQDKFEADLTGMLSEWLATKGNAEREVRLSIPTEDAYVVPIAVKHGFDFINAHPGMVMMTKRLSGPRLSTDGGFDVTLSASAWERGPDRPASLALPTHARSSRPVKRVLLIYNPYAGAKQGQAIAQDAYAMLTNAGIEVHMIRLQRPGHAKELCATMSLDGFDCVAPVGGDGTLHECINGLMSRPPSKHRLVVGAIPAGTGNSFVRELHNGCTWQNSTQRIIRGIHVPIDLLKLTCRGCDKCKDGQITWSFNSVHWGLGAEVNVSAERLRWLGSAVRYSAAAFFELLFGGKKFATISFVDQTGSRVEYSSEKFCLAIINNIRGASKGMVIAPRAHLNDGLVDLLLIRTDATPDLVQLFEGFYHNGSHVNLPFCEYRQVRSVSIESAHRSPNKEEVLDVDGELRACPSFSGEVAPGAIRVIV